ncbi:MAG: sulfatase family protein, partial [Planctomycetota bacterium]
NHAFAKDGTKSVVHYLEPLGYRVALSGKTHIGPREVFPFEYSGKKNPDFDVVDKLMSECKASDTPFCLFACSNEPHSPWNKGDASRYDAAKLKLPPYFVDTPETRENMTRYLAEITYYDWQVGEVLGLLDKHGLENNTLVIVVSEQGSSFPFAKWTCYDSGLQSAFIARWPGRIKPGTVSDAMIEYLDVLPTYIEAAGGTPPQVLDGKSLLPVLFGKAKEHKQYVFGEMTTRGIINAPKHFGIRSIRSRKYKYVWNFTPEVKFQNACTNDKQGIFKSWREKAKTDPDAADKVRRYEHRPGEELFDIVKDPYEWHNLADNPRYADVKIQLRKRLVEWMGAMGDKGQQTELEADEHLARNRNKKTKDDRKRGRGTKETR